MSKAIFLYNVCKFKRKFSHCLFTYRILWKTSSLILWKAIHSQNKWYLYFSRRMKHKQLKCGRVRCWITWGTRLGSEEGQRKAQQNDVLYSHVCILLHDESSHNYKCDWICLNIVQISVCFLLILKICFQMCANMYNNIK